MKLLFIEAKDPHRLTLIKHPLNLKYRHLSADLRL